MTTNKPIALIVDDDRDWLNTIEEGIESEYQVVKARSLAEINKVTDNKDLKITIALVDIRLDDSKINDDSGLVAMFNLNKIGIPCIATTNYDDGDSVRAALIIGRAKDVWFKSERFVILKEKLDNIESRVKEERKEAVNTINFNEEFWKLTRSLLLITFIILASMVVVAHLVPDNFILVTATAIIFTIIIYSLLALFYNKITGEQFTQLIKYIIENK